MTLRKTAGQYHHGDLRDALLRATGAIVKRDGPAAVTMRAVAKRAGVSEAAPYHHFTDKRELLAAAAAQGFRALGAALAASVENAVDPRDAVLALAEAWLRFALAEPGYYRLILGAHVADLDLAAIPETRAAGQAARDLVLDRIRAYLPDADLRLVFHLTWAQLHGTASLFVERELGEGFTEDNAVALARDGVARLLATFA
ncbi:MAG: TetR/AcrR family transcriptional regulator [Deltaproteobacteria bacterium]|nr:TetR/AcrR family transcriptional regulator [Deltaproteobacteria bacterium]